MMAEGEVEKKLPNQKSYEKKHAEFFIDLPQFFVAIFASSVAVFYEYLILNKWMLGDDRKDMVFTCRYA